MTEKADIGKKRGRTGYNWRTTLTDYAAISGLLAGFCVTFIALILSGSIADYKLFGDFTFGHIAVFIFGISSVSFISAIDLFLRAKEFNIFGITKEREDFLKIRLENWKDVEVDHDEKCQKFAFYGRKCYNLSLTLIFIGLLFVIWPYNWLFAVIVSGLGNIIEAIQFFRKI